MTVCLTRWLPLVALLLLTGCGDDSDRDDRPSDEFQGWEIGPVIDGKNYSSGMPRRTATGSFTFPRCGDGLVKYLTLPHRASLDGMTMSLKYEIVGDGELATDTGTRYARVSLYFQQRGDDWHAKGGTEFARWWSRYEDLTSGEHLIEADLVFDQWTSIVSVGTAGDFARARNNPQRVGFTFGGGSGKGHGVCARSGTVKFVLNSFRVY